MLFNIITLHTYIHREDIIEVLLNNCAGVSRDLPHVSMTLTLKITGRTYITHSHY